MATAPVTPDSPPPAPQRRRNLLTFRLGWFFVLIFVASIPLAINTRRTQIAREVLHTIEVLEYGHGPIVMTEPPIGYGGPDPNWQPERCRVDYATRAALASPNHSLPTGFWARIARWYYPPEREAIVGFGHSGDLPLAESDLRGLQFLPHIRHLRLPKAPVDDAGLIYFRNLEELDTLVLFGPGVTDKGLESLAGLRRLVRFTLLDSAITDDGMRTIGRFENLTDLTLCNAAITDAGVKHLTALRNLRRLNLMGTDISDAVVDTLVLLPRLDWLNAYYTRLSATAARRLKNSMDHDVFVHTYPANGK